MIGRKIKADKINNTNITRLVLSPAVEKNKIIELNSLRQINAIKKGIIDNGIQAKFNNRNFLK